MSESHWDHRVVCRIADGEEEFGIHEAHYSDGQLSGWTENPVAAVENSLDDLRITLERMLAACAEPIIDGTEE